MALTLQDRLRKMAQEMDDDERAEREKTTQERIDRLEAAEQRGGLSAEQTETLEKARALLDALEEEDRRDAARGGASGDGGGDGGDGGDPPPKPRTATRPGRKKGQAYDVDYDDKGRPIKLDVARVYGGDDEPDEIEYELDDDEDES